MADGTGRFPRSTVYYRNLLGYAVRKLGQVGEVGRTAYVLSGFLIPHRQEDTLQIAYRISFYVHVYIVPFTDFGQTVDVIVGNVHSACITDFPVDDDNLAVVAVHGVVDIRKGDRVEFDNFDAACLYRLQMTLFQRLVVRPVTERIEHGTHFYTLFYLFRQ